MAYFAMPSDDLLQTAAHTIVGSAEDDEYPPENLTSEDPARPAKLTTTTGSWVIDFGAPPGEAIAAALIYQYLLAGLNVRLQFNATDSWGAPARDFAFTIPAKRLDGPANQRWTNNVLLMLNSDPNNLPNYRFMRMVVVGTNDQVVAVGRLMLLAAWRQVDIVTESGTVASENDKTRIFIQPTELDVETRFKVSGPRREMSGLVVATDLDAGSAPIQEAQTFRDLHESTDGNMKPFLWWPFEDRDPWLVYFTTDGSPRTHAIGGYQVWEFAVRELSRGIPFP
jgi:hypothetical protein